MRLVARHVAPVELDRHDEKRASPSVCGDQGHDLLQASAAGVALFTSAVAWLTFAVARFSAATIDVVDP